MGRLPLQNGTKIILILSVGILILSLFPSSSSAIPAFARKYDLSCTSCHTKPPRLNPFGEAFNMSGFQIPATQEGEIKEKQRIGRVNLERDFLNIFAVRVMGDFVESFQGGDQTEANLAFPNELELFLAGTLTQDISYFFEIKSERLHREGEGGGGSEFTLDRSFLIFNVGSMMRGSPPLTAGPTVIGPMIRIGLIDPSTFFSAPYERQYFKGIPGRVDASGTTKRFGLAQPGLAHASKFFGMKNGKGNPIEVTEAVLYNGESFGIDLHALVGSFILQTGILQGIGDESRDVNTKKDPYLMGRLNFGWREYLSGSLSGLVNWGNDTAMVNNDLIDWFRYGFAGNVRYQYFDIYGAIIWDKVDDLPKEALAAFDEEAFGITVEIDFLAADRFMLMAKYDYLDAGGFIDQKADGKVLSLQGRYYLRDNLGIYLRDSYNLKRASSNPLNNYSNLLVVGVDWDW